MMSLSRNSNQELLKAKLLQSLLIQDEHEQLESPRAGSRVSGQTYTELSAVNYNNSTFPSLLNVLGPTPTAATKRKSKKAQQTLFDADHSKKGRHREHDRISFAEQMKKRNETQWLRIEAVARENMDRYEKYAREMARKLKKQREQINQRSQEMLDSLSRMEIKKREDHLYSSTHGRMWRHHRSMQRRAYELEPIRAPPSRETAVTVDAISQQT